MKLKKTGFSEKEVIGIMRKTLKKKVLLCGAKEYEED